MQYHGFDQVNSYKDANTLRVLMALNNSEIIEEQLQELETIRINHDEAYLYVSQALSYQEQHQYRRARDTYEKSIEKIDKALNVRCDRPYCHGPKWDEACKLQQEMRMKTQMIKSQLRDIQNCIDEPPTTNRASNIHFTPTESSELPPTYNEACEHELIAVSRESSSLGASSENGLQMNNSEVVELFSIQEDVMMFYISNNGSVSATSTHSPLYIYQFVEHDAVEHLPPAWLQIGRIWTYPFIPGQSPVLESAYGAFIFPNVILGEGSAVGVILPPTVDATERAQFLGILNSLTEFKGEDKKVPLPPKYESHTSKAGSFSDTISRGIATGAEYLSDSIVKGATLSSDRIHKEAAKSRQNINLEAKHIAVDPHVKKGSKMAQEASGVALKATGYLVKKLGDLTLALGKHLAPHIKEQGSKLLSTAFNKDKADANETMDGVLNVTAGGIQGISTVFAGLELAARTLAYSLSQETVNVVGYKYGTEAAEVVENALFAVGNLALTTHNVQSLGVNSIAKKTAKDAGKAVVTEYAKNENQDGETKTIDDDDKKLPKK